MADKLIQQNIIDIPTPYHRVWKGLQIDAVENGAVIPQRLLRAHHRLNRKIKTLQARIHELETRQELRGKHHV